MRHNATGPNWGGGDRTGFGGRCSWACRGSAVNNAFDRHVGMTEPHAGIIKGLDELRICVLPVDRCMASMCGCCDGAHRLCWSCGHVVVGSCEEGPAEGCVLFGT